MGKLNITWLVVEPTPLKNMKISSDDFPIYGQNVSIHQPIAMLNYQRVYSMLTLIVIHVKHRKTIVKHSTPAAAPTKANYVANRTRTPKYQNEGIDITFWLSNNIAVENHTFDRYIIYKWVMFIHFPHIAV